MLKSLILFFVLAAAIDARPQQDNRPWPVGSSLQQQNSGGNPAPSGFNSQQSWQNPNQQPPIAGGQPFGQNLAGQNQQQPWMAGSNPSFAGPQPGQGSLTGGQVPPNNPPPGTVTGADRAAIGAGGSNPQWGNQNQPQWGNQNNQQQPNWQGQGQQPTWQQSGQPGGANWNTGGQGSPGNPNNPNWGQNNPNQANTPSTPYPGRPWAGATTSRPCFFFSLSLIALVCCLTRFFM